MNRSPVYIPIFRLRQEEQKVLLNFDFRPNIYPYVEIVKELDVVRKQSTKKKKDGTLPKPPKVKTFEQIHLPVIAGVKSAKVFVDLPVHFVERRGAKPVVIDFMTSVVNNRQMRTSFMKKFGVLSDKVIPIISTYFHKSNEQNSIILQEVDLRPVFVSIGFRTSINTYKNDLIQIKQIAKDQDFLLLDLENCEVDATDPEISEMMERLADFNNCPLYLLRSALDKEMTNKGLNNGQVIHSADNSLLYQFKHLGGVGFGDYVGIKRDDLQDGGTISPGFVFYDATANNFYGFKGADKKPKLEDFLEIIVPNVLSCSATGRMGSSGRLYLSNENKGWKMLNDMIVGTEPSKSQGKFKRISMEHYLHCMKIMIESGDFT